MIDINPRTLEAYRLFHNGTLAFARTECQGIRVDLEYVQREKQHLNERITQLENQFRSTKFYKHWEHTTRSAPNIHSNPQLSRFLYKIKKLDPVKLTTGGQGSTNEESLRLLDVPELDALLNIRSVKKTYDYLDAFEREQINGYLHPHFNLHLVQTFRSSSDSPNFQNIPVRDEESKRLTRGALYPRPGHQLLEIDYKGLEVCVAACYTKDSKLIQYVSNPASDMHKDMAEQLFIIHPLNKSIESHNTLRQAAKNGFVFPQFYGSYYKNCAMNLACDWGKLPPGAWAAGRGIPLVEGTLSDHLRAQGIKSLKSFENHVQEVERDFWDNRFVEYTDWKNRWWKGYQKYGYIDMYTGFRCSGLMSFKEVVNYPIQGSAFHCLLWSFIEADRLMRRERWDSRLIGQIHDSMLWDVAPKELNRVMSAVQTITCERLPKAWKWIIIPMNVEMEVSPADCSWAEKRAA